MKLKSSRASRLLKVEFSINTVDLEVKYLYNHLNAAAICLRTSATQFSATTSISTLEPITGRKSETAIPRNIDGSRIGKTIRRSRYNKILSFEFKLNKFELQCQNSLEEGFVLFDTVEPLVGDHPKC